MVTSDDWPAGLSLATDAGDPLEFRALLGKEIHAFHDQSVPSDARRLACAVRDPLGGLAAGVCVVVSWQWMFIEALWVSDTWRGRGIGRRLMALVEIEALAAGCHSSWLDTFQAREFYEALGYRVFGELADYPPGHSRFFLRKRLMDASKNE